MTARSRLPAAGSGVVGAGFAAASTRRDSADGGRARRAAGRTRISNAWNVAGAKAFGFQVVWVNRRGAPFDELGVTPDLEVRDLGALVRALGR